MFSGIRALGRKPSMESFVSPTARASESATSTRGTVRHLRSMSQLSQPRTPLPQISPLLVTRTATVHVRHKTLAWKTWIRQSLRLTKHTISLHRYPDSDVLDIIVLRKVRHVERVGEQQHCLRVETTEDKAYYFAFSSEEELYTWLTDIHLGIGHYSKPTNFSHVVHVEPDKTDTQRLIGLPEDWEIANTWTSRESITREMVEAALPEISVSEYPDVEFSQEFPGSRPITPDSQFEDEGEAIILKAQTAIRAVNQRLINMQSGPPLKIITQDCSFQPTVSSSLLTASTTTSDYSPSTPGLTPDTSLLTPFRESPYRYRDSDAQDLSGQICKMGDWADAHGGYADIWRAQWKRDVGISLHVAVKVLRVHSQDENVRAKIQKRLRKEVRVWHQLRHKNIVQMYGTCDGFGPFPSMVSAWYEKGNVMAYLDTLGDAATAEQRLKLLTEVACGLNYLHTFVFPLAPDNTIGGHIVHGDLKGANILVNEQGEAALADFGLSSVIAFAGEATTSTFNGGSVRWMAPELLFTSPHDGTQKTRASDTYSYGSVILEIITGERPYNDVPTDILVINQLAQGYTPKRPLKSTLNPGVWALMERCWSTTPSDRPEMAFVLSRMEKFYNEQRKSII